MEKQKFLTDALFIPDVKNEDSGSLKTWIVATHADIEINNRIYPNYVMKRDVRTWLTPYRKPVLVHHADEDDAVGRTLEAYYFDNDDLMAAQSLVKKEIKLREGSTGFILLRAIVNDPQAIDKILDDRYMTVSIGFRSTRAICSICGNNWSVEQCKHVPGRTYDDEKALLIIEDMEFTEISFVNNPADSHAKVVVKEREEEFVNTDEIEKNKVKSYATENIDAETFNRMIQGKGTFVYIPDLETYKGFVNNNPIADSESHYPITGDDTDSSVNGDVEISVNGTEPIKGNDDDTNKNTEEDSDMESNEKLEALQKQFDELTDFVKKMLVDKIIEAKKIMGIKKYEDKKFADEKKEKYMGKDIQTLVLIVDELNETLCDEECEQEEAEEKPKEEISEDKEEPEKTEDKEETEEIKEEPEEVKEDKEKKEDIQEEEEKPEDDKKETDKKDENVTIEEEEKPEKEEIKDEKDAEKITETVTESKEEQTATDKEEKENVGIQREEAPGVMSNDATSKNVENYQEKARRKLGI